MKNDKKFTREEISEIVVMYGSLENYRIFIKNDMQPPKRTVIERKLMKLEGSNNNPNYIQKQREELEKAVEMQKIIDYNSFGLATEDELKELKNMALEWKPKTEVDYVTFNDMISWWEARAEEQLPQHKL